jgi:glutaconate CoA-transferase, subunit A
VSKVVSLADAIALVRDGDRVALGGNTLHRAPCAAVHEIIRQGRRGLTLVKTAGSYDIDALCRAGCAAAVEAGYVGYENVLGMAPDYRRAVEEGRVEAREHSCYTVIAGFRAAAQGVPFMPIAGIAGSDLVKVRGWQTVRDPYGGAEVLAIPAIAPDVAILHVQEADDEGDGAIGGPRFEDLLMANAAKRVIVTCERLVAAEELAGRDQRAEIPRYQVDAVVVAPKGAWPLACPGEYSYDLDYLQKWVNDRRS